MARPFDDTTRRNIAELCAAFTRGAAGEPAPTLKRAAVAIALTEAETRQRDGVSADPARGAACVAHRRNGRCRAGAAITARRRRRPRCASCMKSLALRSARATCSACSTIIRPGPAISSRRWWCGRRRRAISSQSGRGRLRASHRARRYRAGGRLQLHHDPRKHAARDPLSSRRPHHPRADGGADLSVPRSAGRPRYPCGRTGTAGVCCAEK